MDNSVQFADNDFSDGAKTRIKNIFDNSKILDVNPDIKFHVFRNGSRCKICQYLNRPMFIAVGDHPQNIPTMCIDCRFVIASYHPQDKFSYCLNCIIYGDCESDDYGRDGFCVNCQDS